jgi:hypothetical protein
VRGEIGDRDDLGVAIVTMGRPEEAAAFCRTERLPFTCLSDRARAAYRAYGLRRGTALQLMQPEAMLGYARAASKGYFPSAPVGDAYQLGGIFLVGTDGRIIYAHYPRHPTDHPPAGELARVAGRA